MKEQITAVTYLQGVTVTAANQRILIGPNCPRGAKMTLQQAKIGIIMRNTVLQGDFQSTFALTAGRSNQLPLADLSNQQVVRSKPLWMGHGGLTVEEVTAVGQRVLLMPTINEDLDFSESEHPGVTVFEDGDGDENGFTLNRWTEGITFPLIDIFASLQILLEYLDTSRSTSPTWSIDQSNEEEAQQ